MKNDDIIELLQRIDKKLGLILGNQIVEKEGNIKAQVSKLAKSDLSSVEIAQILGISAAHASKELSILKKVKKHESKTKE
mgnify:FL=1|jgi:hypothetical protein